MTKIPCLIVIIFICIFITDSYSQLNQPHDSYNLRNNQNLHSISENNLTNFPFQFGLEFGPSLPVKEKKYFYNGWWIYGNINLYLKRIFLRKSYGNLKLNADLGSSVPYLFLSSSFIPLKFRQHSIGFYLGLSYYVLNRSTGIMSYSAGLNYLYRLNKYVSLSAGIQMPVIRESRYDEYYQNPFLTIGIQFF